MEKKIHSELLALAEHLEVWRNFLSANGFANFSEMLVGSFERLEKSFEEGDHVRYEALLDFQDRFQGGMGSINDLPIDDISLRKAVEAERDLLLKKYYALSRHSQA